MYVLTDARPQTPAPTVPGHQLRAPVHARAPLQSPAAAVSAPSAGPPDIVFTGGRIPAAQLAQPTPPTPAPCGRRSRSQGFCVRFRATIQVLQDRRQRKIAVPRRRDRAAAAAPVTSGIAASAQPAQPATAQPAATGAAIVSVPTQKESMFAGQRVSVTNVVGRRRGGRRNAPPRQGRVFG